MRILWFVQENFDPSREKVGYNGAGWISSLRNEIIKKEGVELALAFFSNKKESGTANNVKYYSMLTPALSPFKKIALRLKGYYIKEEEALWPAYREEMLKVLDDFKPDIIQIFGSENKYGLVAAVTDIPVVLHIQGIVNPCLNAYLPPFVSWEKSTWLKSIIKRPQRINWLCLQHSEQEVFRFVKHYIGRTEWDKRVVTLLSEGCHYYYGSEILRDVFYDAEVNRKLPSRITIISTISQPLYKGYDLILKTASLLKNLKMDFVWKVIGNINPDIVEGLVGLKHEKVNVELLGVLSAEQIKKELLNCTIYVHPSYIDNSPNSVCEAQMLGVTCIATNVGGVSSIISEGKTGFLVPANDPFQTAYLIQIISKNKSLNLQIGINARAIANTRHNKNKIVEGLLDIYNNLIQK